MAIDDEKIRERAYYLWEKEGSPDGRDAEFWERARLLVEAESAPRPAERTDAAASHEERKADQAMMESFPASDPPSFTADVGARGRSGQGTGVT